LSFIEHILRVDQELLVFFNALGNEKWDFFWLNITNKYIWLPLYIILLFLIFKYYGWKKALFTVFIIALLITFTDQLVNLIKDITQRIRPNNDETIKNLIRVVKNSSDFSFVSGHAANSFAVSIFVILSLKNYFKPIYFLLIWPLLFAYSRLYLGVHYPLDVLSGAFLGILIGIGFYKVNGYFNFKIFYSNES
jgi:undecaprenyl-diphosphatase